MGPDPGHLGDIDAAGEHEERRADVEEGLVLAGSLALRPSGEFALGGRALGHEVANEGFDLFVTGSDLVLVDVEELDGLAEREDEFGSVVAGEGRDEFVGRGLAAVVAMAGEQGGVGVAGDDVAEEWPCR